jgi:CubicO group peptidase (beta-lactamase class C family)
VSADAALVRRLSRRLRAFQAESRAPSVCAAVGQSGRVVWSEAVGLADAGSGSEATPSTQYRVGSITKTFTAAALMQLRDGGALGLEDRLSDHVPAAAGGGLTLRRLLAHLSGLQREPPGRVWDSLVLPPREHLPDLLSAAERVLEPGAAWHYSNLAYAALGEVVRLRAGAPCEQVVEERLLRPLALERTGWTAVLPAAAGYLVDPHADRLLPEPDVDLGGLGTGGRPLEHGRGPRPLGLLPRRSAPRRAAAGDGRGDARRAGDGRRARLERGVGARPAPSAPRRAHPLRA